MPVVARRMSSTSTRFIGRAEPLALFDDVLADLLADHGVFGEVLLVGGEAGVGKSRLVGELSDRARVAGAVVLRGWCIEHGDDVMPLAPVADLLRDIVALATSLELDEIIGPAVEILSRLVPEFDPDRQPPRSESPLSMVSLSDGVLRALRGLSERRPVVVVLEDLHWSDASTRQLLMFLAPRISRHRVVLIATYRTDELHRRHPLRPFLVSLRRAIRPEPIELSPFTGDELAELVADITGTVPAPQVVDRLHDRCAGNAFFAEELLAGEVFGRPSALLRDAVLARTDILDEDAMTVLRVASAAGPGVDVPVLAGASGLSAARFEPAVEAIVAAGLCVRDADRIRFRHELAREIVDDEILTGDRPGVHAALASTMQSLTPLRTGEIARHWMVAGHQSAALAASVAAGRAAAAVAADAEALTQFERALELWDRVPDAAACAGCDHAGLLLDAADTAGRARLFDRAMALGRRGVAEIARNNPTAEGFACLRLVPWAFFSFEDADLRVLIERASAGIAEDPPGGGTALALAWRALLDVATNGYTPAAARAARPIAHRAVELARANANARAEVHAEITLGVCTCIDGNPDGVREIRMALERAKAQGFPMEAGRAYDSLAVYLAEFERHDEVIDLEQEALDYCTAAGVYRTHGVMVQLRVIRALHRRGHWQSVQQRVERLRAEFGTLTIEHLTLADSWGLILVRQGRPDGVRDMVDDTFSRLGDHREVIGPVTVTAIELQAALGLVAPIPDLVESALGRILPDFAKHAAAVVAAAIGALADLTVGSTVTRRDDLQTYRRRADAWLTRVRNAQPPAMPPWMPIADAERTRLDNEPSAPRWAAAVDAWQGLQAPYESAYTQLRLAEVLLTGGDRQSAAVRARARTLLMDARQAAARLGAQPLNDRIDTLAARAHLSLDLPRGTRTSDDRADDEHGLTEREAEVLRLVAQGYSNGQIGQALFISRKTASVHVSNILRKLSVSSRVEAATRWVNPP